jgi:hypothetical protein
MKYIVAACLLILSGCANISAHIRSATVSVIGKPAQKSVAIAPAIPSHEAEDRTCTLYTDPELDTLLPETPNSAAQQVLAKINWELPPFTWAPSWCAEINEHLWPDYSSVTEAECTWWFFPQDRSHSICESRWTMHYGEWTQQTLSCMLLDKPKTAVLPLPADTSVHGPKNIFPHKRKKKILLPIW